MAWLISTANTVLLLISPELTNQASAPWVNGTAEAGGQKKFMSIEFGDVPAHVANGRALLINDYAASPLQARPLSLVAGAECAA